MDSSDRIWRERGLLSAVLAGDERAWRTWYEESFQPLYAYVHWRSGGLPERADEVVQETWLIAVRRIRSFDPERGSFLAWLRGVATNVLRNRARSENGRAGRVRPLEEDRPLGRPNPVDGAELAERIGAALGSLPDRYEAALRAKYLEEQTVLEIAGAWNETPKAIESLLTRARQAFREAYTRLE